MNIVRKLLVGAAILGMALAGAAIGEGAASASTVPVVYGFRRRPSVARLRQARQLLLRSGCCFRSSVT